MKNSLKMIISSLVVIAILFVMVNYAFATSALTPSSNLTAGSAEVPDDDTNTNSNSNSSGRVIISNSNSSSTNTNSSSNRVNVIGNTNTNRSNNLPATGQEDIVVVGGMLIVLLGVAGYTYYKMKNANM